MRESAADNYEFFSGKHLISSWAEKSVLGWVVRMEHVAVHPMFKLRSLSSNIITKKWKQKLDETLEWKRKGKRSTVKDNCVPRDWCLSNQSESQSDPIYLAIIPKRMQRKAHVLVKPFARKKIDPQLKWKRNMEIGTGEPTTDWERVQISSAFFDCRLANNTHVFQLALNNLFVINKIWKFDLFTVIILQNHIFGETSWTNEGCNCRKVKNSMTMSRALVIIPSLPRSLFDPRWPVLFDYSDCVIASTWICLSVLLCPSPRLFLVKSWDDVRWPGMWDESN